MVQASLIALLLAVAASVGHALKVPTDPYPVGSTFVAKQEPSNENHEGVREGVRELDIANNNKYGPHPVILNPIAINIYYGAAWTQAQRDLMDLFTSNLGSTPYMSTVQTLKDPSGATVAPLKFGGSFFDNVVDSKVTFGADSQKEIQKILQGYINAKNIGGTAIDITNTDFKNTIFNLVTSPKVTYAVTGSCGYHSVTTLSSNPANPATTNDLRVIYSINGASICNPFIGALTNGQGGNGVISKSAPNDAAVDGVLVTLTHEIFESISDGIFPFQSWYNWDDVHFDEKNPPTFTNKGNNNENSDLCAWTFGLDVTKLYNTAKPNNVVTKNAQGLYEFNANIIVGGKYFLVPQNYVYSPPNSQCAMSASAIKPLPAATTTMALTFINMVNDANTYYPIVLYYKATTWQYVWQGPAVAYGKSVQFFQVFPPGTRFGGIRLVRSSDNKIVASRYPSAGEQWTIDNINSQAIFAWVDAQNNIYVNRFGPSGTYTTSNIIAFNSAYPYLKTSDVIWPYVTVTDASKKPVASTSSNLVGATSYSANQNQPTTTNFFALNTYVSSPGVGNALDVSGWTFTCTQQGKETLTATAAAGTTVPAGTTVYFFCLDNAAMQTIVFSPSGNTFVSTMATTTNVKALAGPITGAVATGYLALSQYGESSCQSTSQVTIYSALGQCVQTGLSRSVIKSATTSNSVYTFVGTDFASINCDPATAGPGLESDSLDTATTVCVASPQKNAFLTATYAAALPPVPAGQLAKYSYADAATCASGTAAPLQATYFAPTCSVYYGSAYQEEMCAANVTVASTTGGFFMQRFYGAPGCTDTPLVTRFYQLNVCGQMTDSGSFKYVSNMIAGSVTLFQLESYDSNDCSGNPTSSSLAGTYYAEYIVSQANTTQLCDPTGLADPGLGFVSVVYAPVLAFSSGWGQARFNTYGACNTLNTTRLFSGVQYTSGCVKDADTASNYISVAGCGNGNTGVGTANSFATTVTATIAFQGVDLATARSAAFQAPFIQALAAYAGVAASTVSIASVTPVQGSRRRRALLQNGPLNIIVVINNVRNNNIPALNRVLANAGPAIINALLPLFLGLALYIAPVTTATSAFWTPGAIAGVVIAGVVAIVLIVLLSVLIPRMQQYRQAQVFGQGYPNQTPPAQFYGSSPQAQVPQQMEAGVQMAGKTVSF